jgi:hypothetical protein
MNQADFERVVDSTIQTIRQLLVVKGGEYAGPGEDRLANFKRGAALTGCTPLQVLLIYLSKHYDGVASYVQTDAVGATRPSSEPIEGRFDDIINYCLLAKALIAEQKMVADRVVRGDGDRFAGGVGDTVDGLPHFRN